MPSRYFDRRDRREPEKTPLIDVIFLLLIFFFVAIVGLDVTPKPTHGYKAGGTKIKLDLLAMSNPDAPAPDSLHNHLLLQVTKGRKLDEKLVNKMNELIQRARALGLVYNGNPQGIRRDEFVIMLYDHAYSDLLALPRVVLQLESRLRNLNANSPDFAKREAQRLLDYLPVNLPNKETFDEPRYKRAISHLENRLRAYYAVEKKRDLHVYMNRNMYVRIIHDLFHICNETEISRENIHFRVVEKKLT